MGYDYHGLCFLDLSIFVLPVETPGHLFNQDYEIIIHICVPLVVTTPIQ